jgi:periplasmic protein TonB
MDLFRRCFTVSFIIHATAFGIYYLPKIHLFSSEDDKIFNANNMQNKNVDVDFLYDLPPSIQMGGNTNPAPVEKEEWIEGTGKDKPDADNTDVNINKLSGTGTDPDGYMFAELSDHPPIAIIDFDLNDYFPQEARSRDIYRKTVTLQMQIDEKGSVKSAKVVSQPAGFGFDDAALKVANRLRFRPGKVKGRPVKMVYQLPIQFVLEQ